MKTVFDKLKVVELASVLAGPSVGQFFAELGAEVIKIENPDTQGDVTRSWLFSGESKKDSRSSYFSSVNWGKKSVLLNLKKQKSRRVLHNLIQEADIVIASYKPGDAEKLQVDYNTLSQVNPALIYGHITGYGPADHRVGYDAVIQAESGFMSINGERGRGGLKMPVALIDVLAGHQLKQGILISLINRMTSGKGNYVPVSLIDAAVSSLVNQAANWLVGEAVPSRTGNEHPNIAPYGDVFKTSDDQELILAVGNDRQFQSLNKVLCLKLDDGEDFNCNSSRVQNRVALNKKLSESIGEWSAADLVAKLGDSGVPVGVIKKINEVFAEAPEYWLLTDGGMTGVRTFMATPDNSLIKHTLSAPPELGADTLEVVEKYS